MPLCSAESSSITLSWLCNLINRSEAFVRNCFVVIHLLRLNAESSSSFQLLSQFIYFHIKQKFKNSCARNARRRIFTSILKTITEIPRKQHGYLLTTYLVHGTDRFKTKYKNLERYKWICFRDMQIFLWSLFVIRQMKSTSRCNRIQALPTGI